MGYLVLKDYATYIQGDYLRQLTQGNDDKRITEENVSLQTIAQRLTQKYDLNTEFKDTLPYDRTKAYTAADRVVVDISANGFTAWVAAADYAVDDLVIYNAVGYICTTLNSDATFDPANWSAIAPQHTIFYGAYPSTCTLQGEPNPATLMSPFAPVFDYKALYKRGDVVFWRGNTWVCNQDSIEISHTAALQFVSIENIPYANVFPTDPLANATEIYWTDRTAYTIVPDTPLTDDAWIRGDNRNQTIKDAMVRITVFKLSPLIAPRNIPDVWLEDYRSIMRELKDASLGNITMLLPMKQPQKNLKTFFGGFIKNMNNYALLFLTLKALWI